MVKIKNKKGKGINSAVAKNIKHKEYLNVLINKKVTRHKRKRIQSKQHKIGTCDVCNISLSFFDDKIYILDDGINTVAYFHKDRF